ncbi:MAG: hypothetical protein ACP6IP_07790 [Candidatus Njordarchaeia archaeon]
MKQKYKIFLVGFLTFLFLIGTLSSVNFAKGMENNLENQTAKQKNSILEPINDGDNYNNANEKVANPILRINPMVTWSESPGGWWDTDWEYRINVTITEPGISDRSDWPVDVYVKFTPPAFKYSIRVIRWDGIQYTETPYQPWNITYYNSTHISSATITFLVNLLKGSSVKYQIYWSTSYKDLPTYPKRITVDEVSVSNGIMYVLSSSEEGWSVKLPPDKGGKVMNITLPSGDEVGHTWTQFGVTRNATLDHEGYWGDADTNNIRFVDRYLEEKEDPLMSAFMGVVFVTYVVEGVPLYYNVQGVDLAKVNYYLRFYDFGYKIRESVYSWNSGASTYLSANYFLGGWVFDQDDGATDATFDYIYTPTGLVNMSKATYPEKYGSVTDTWSVHKIYDSSSNLPLIQIFRVYLTSGTHTETIWTAGDDYYSNSWSADDPYGRVMDPNGNWLTITDIGSSDYVVDNGYAIWHDGGGAGSGVDFSFDAPVDGYYYIIVGVLDDDNGDGDMDFRVEIDGNDIGYGKLYTGFITSENDLTYLIPRSAISIQDFYPDSDLVGISHKMTISWSSSDHDLDLMLFSDDGSVAGYSISTSGVSEEIAFTPSNQVHYSVLTIRYSGTGSSSYSLNVEALMGAEYEDFYGRNSTWDRIAFYHSTASRGIGFIKSNLAYSGLTLTDSNLLYYNEGNDSDIDYIYWAYNVSIVNPSVSGWLNFSYYVIPWSPSGTTSNERVSGFLEIYDCLNNPVSIAKSNIERFKIKLVISVLDSDNAPVAGSKVELINTTDLTVSYTAYTNSSGYAIIDAIRHGYTIKVTVSSVGKSYINDTLTIDYSTYAYTIHSDSRTVKMKDIVRVRIKAVTDTSPKQVIQDGRFWIENSTDSTIHVETYTNLTGWIDIYLKTGSWKFAFNATSTASPDPWDTITVYSDSGYTTVVAGPSINVTLTINTGIIYYMVDNDMTQPPIPTRIVTYNTLDFYDVYWKQLVTLYFNLTRSDTGDNIDGKAYWWIFDSAGNLVANGDANNVTTGSYNVTINTTTLQAGQGYTIKLNATPVAKIGAQKTLKPAPVTIALNVKKRPITLDVTFDPGKTTYWNETLTITVAVRDGLSGTLLSGVTVSGVIYASSPIYLNFDEVSRGIYENVTRVSYINTATYTLDINASLSNYELNTKSFALVITERPTAIAYNNYIVIPWQSSYELTVDYLDSVSSSDITNANVTYIMRDSTTGALISSGQLLYTSGAYRSDLDLTTVLEGTYRITIYAHKQNYEAQTGIITLVLREHVTSASPDATRITVIYGNNVSISITYTDTDYSLPIVGATVKTAEVVSNQEGVQSRIYTLLDLGNGIYKLEFNSSDLQVLGGYTITITLQKTHYQLQRLLITLTVNPIPTSATSDKAREEREWGENITITITYNRTDTEQGIGNADNKTYVITGGTISLNGQLVDYNNGTYKLQINTTKLGVGTYTLTAYLEKAFHENQTVIILIEVKNISTFTYSDYSSITLTWSESAQFNVYYNRSKDHVGIGGASVTAILKDVETGQTVDTLSVTSIQSGVYRISVDSSQYTVGSYYIQIQISKANYTAQSTIVTLAINPVPTIALLNSTDVTVYWGEMFTVNYTYLRTDTDSGVSGATVIYYIEDITGKRTHSAVVDTTSSNGYIIIGFNSTMYSPGVYVIHINSTLSNYETATASVNVKVLLRPVTVALSSPTVNIVWGDRINVSLSIKDALTDSYITDVEVVISPNLNGTLTVLGESNGTIIIGVDSTKLNETLKDYPIFIYVTKTNYEPKTVPLSITVKPISLEIRVIGQSSVILNPVTGGTTTYKVGVFDKSRGGIPVPNATVQLVIISGDKNYTVPMKSFGGEPGYYEATIDWASMPIFKPGQRYSIGATVKELSINGVPVPVTAVSSSVTGTTAVNVDYLGGSTDVPFVGRVPALIFYPVIVVVLIIGSVVGYRVIMYMRLPVEVKEIDRLVKVLEKGIYEYEAPSREDTIRELLEEEMR